MKILVIPDVHLKPWMFHRAAVLMKTTDAEKAVCLMDIPDDWNKEWDLELYKETFEAAIRFQKSNMDTLWCYGNHDLSYEWIRDESGFTYDAIPIVKRRLDELRETLPDSDQMKYIHRIDNVLFMHGGLTQNYVKRFASDVDQDDVDAVLTKLNSLGADEMWLDGSPIWLRPQKNLKAMYKKKDFLQVVGHTPMERIDRFLNILSCDVFSTHWDGTPVGTEEFVLLDTVTWEYEGVK